MHAYTDLPLLVSRRATAAEFGPAWSQEPIMGGRGPNMSSVPTPSPCPRLGAWIMVFLQISLLPWSCVASALRPVVWRCVCSMAGLVWQKAPPLLYLMRCPLQFYHLNLRLPRGVGMRGTFSNVFLWCLLTKESQAWSRFGYQIAKGRRIWYSVYVVFGKWGKAWCHELCFQTDLCFTILYAKKPTSRCCWCSCYLGDKTRSSFVSVSTAEGVRFCPLLSW